MQARLYLARRDEGQLGSTADRNQPPRVAKHMPKAWRVHEYGHYKEKLRFEDIEAPEPPDGGAVIKVLAAGVNFPDLLAIAGKYQVKAPLPFTPGLEACGEVIAVGANSQLRVGQRIIASAPWGSFAEQMPVMNFWSRKSNYAGGLLNPASPLVNAAPSTGDAPGVGALNTGAEGAVPLLSRPIAGTFGAIFSSTIGDFPFSATLSLLANRGYARTLTEPTLVALSGQSASFLAGGEFPIPLPQSLGTIGVEYKEFGIQLKFTPTVVGDTIQLDMNAFGAGGVTNTAAALAASRDLLTPTPNTGYHVLLVSDGAPCCAGNSAALARNVANTLWDRDITIFTLEIRDNPPIASLAQFMDVVIQPTRSGGTRA